MAGAEGEGEEGERGMGELTIPAEEGQVEPLNEYIRVQEIQVDGETVSGTVTDVRQEYAPVEFGDRVYFRKSNQVILRINGQEVCFVKTEDIVFRVGL
jgi:hypothetical protein